MINLTINFNNQIPKKTPNPILITVSIPLKEKILSTVVKKVEEVKFAEKDNIKT